MECETCGGTEFIKETGFYYCADCQTQSQEIREHVFQEEITNVKSGKKIKTVKVEDRADNKVTSWECYNIILSGLTQELVKLGAKPDIKKVVRTLWMKYLEKLEILNFERDARPKFQAVNLKKNVEIIFNTNKRKRKRKKSEKSDTDDSLSLDTMLFKRARTKKKQALAQAQYDEYSLKSTQETNISLMNETLSSLKSSQQMEPELEISFNRSASEELHKRMSKEHTQLHGADVLFKLQCHKLTYSEATKTYKHSAGVLSPNKLYAILYLALLINRDSIQLGDILRFAREGHLSFNNFDSLFPEEYKDKKLGIANYQTNKEMSHRQYREYTMKMATLLDVISYIETPDLLELCKRYCDELNLPRVVYSSVLTVFVLCAIMHSNEKKDQRSQALWDTLMSDEEG